MNRSTHVNQELTQLSYETCKNRFDSEGIAKIYSTRHVHSKKGKREMACIKQALMTVKKGAWVLDLPCGTGRLSYFIHQLGFRVTGADYSSHMLEYAKKNPSANVVYHPIEFEQQDVMSINHPDNTFDATVCNRLFHHYPTSELRQKALKELARITKGPIIVSFFNSYSLSAIWSKIKNTLRNKTPYDRVPISFYVFKRDIEACGLQIEKTFYSNYGISPQTYVRLIKCKLRAKNANSR